MSESVYEKKKWLLIGISMNALAIASYSIDNINTGLHLRHDFHHCSYSFSFSDIYQSSSSSFRPCILICLALNASAKPPAKLGALPLSGLSGVVPPLPPLTVLMLTALSLGAGGGAGFLPPPGRFGGAGGVGFALAAGAREALPFMPFTDAEGGGAGTARATGWGGAGGGMGLGLSSAR